jgi:tetratricopeptide (TPR) repeat protein
LYNEEARKPRVKQLSPRFVIGAAAAILAAVVLSWLFFQRTIDAPTLAERYIAQNLAILPQKMGVEDRMQKGITSYNEGRFPDALQQFDSLLRADSVNPSALLDAGIVSLRMQNYDKALDYFLKLQNHTDPRVSPALFYQALTLMRRNRTGDSDLAKQQLMRIVREDLNRKEDAQELLGKL